jgi:hypothetical protein
MKSTALIVVLLTIFLSLILAPAVLAHGGEPRLELGTERLYPGGALEVRGVGFEAEEALSLFLIGPAIKMDLGEITPDVEGEFNQVITLPADLAIGVYHLQAVASDHDLSSPDFTVLAGAVPSGEQGEQRQIEEPLLAPLPTFPAVAATQARQLAPVAGSATSAPAETVETGLPNTWWAFVLGGVILVGFGFVVIKFRQ